MRRNVVLRVLVLLASVLLMVSCSKEVQHEEQANANSAAYSLPKGNLVVVVDSVGGLPLSGALADFNRLCVAVYDATGKRIKQINQNRDDVHFGEVGFQLDEGEYRVLAVAHSSNSNPTMTNPAKVQFNNSTGYTDTYKHFDSVEVDEDKRVLHLGLERIVARCGVVVSDCIPDDVAKVLFTYKGGSGHFDATTGLGVTQSTQKAVFEVRHGMRNFRFDIYTFPHALLDTLQITISAVDEADSVLVQRNVVAPIMRNAITWLSGALFDTSVVDWVEIDTLGMNERWDSELYVQF